MSKTSDIHELTNILAKALRHKIGAMVNSIENSSNKVTNSLEFSKGQFFKTSDTINRIVHNEIYAKDADLLVKEAKKTALRQNWNSYDKGQIKNELRKKLRFELEKKDFLDDRKFDMMDEEIDKVLKELELA